MSLKGKVVIITGSSSGIGASMAIKFSKEGAKVVIIGRNAEKLEKVQKACSTFCKKPLVINADVSKESDAEKIVELTIQTYGQIDVLINNAGIVRYAAVSDENVLAVYDEIMNTNVRAVLYLTHLATPHLIKSKGNIIMVSSIGSQLIRPASFIIYYASKAALNHMTTCIAAELAPHGVRVNTISPGPVLTDIAVNSGIPEAANKAFWDNGISATALKRISEPDEMADLALFLASGKAVGMTGSNIISDNGMQIS